MDSSAAASIRIATECAESAWGGRCGLLVALCAPITGAECAFIGLAACCTTPRSSVVWWAVRRMLLYGDVSGGGDGGTNEAGGAIGIKGDDGTLAARTMLGVWW